MSRSYAQKVPAGLFLALTLTATATAQDLAIDWWTIDGGGDLWTVGGDFELSGTIGQPDAGVVMTGGDFALIGGFWATPTAPTPPPICLGDCDCDGVIDFNDINALVAVLSGGDPCRFGNVDVNGDGLIDFDDINPFVEILSGSSGPCP